MCQPLLRLEPSPRKMSAFFYANNWWSLCSSVGLCHLAAGPIHILALTQVVNRVRVLTGCDTGPWDLVQVAEREKALARVLNGREGSTARDDTPVKRLTRPSRTVLCKDVRTDPGKFSRVLHPYHQLGRAGIPRRAGPPLSS